MKHGVCRESLRPLREVITFAMFIIHFFRLMHELVACETGKYFRTKIFAPQL